jgi:hypothetical protein
MTAKEIAEDWTDHPTTSKELEVILLALCKEQREICADVVNVKTDISLKQYDIILNAPTP